MAANCEKIIPRTGGIRCNRAQHHAGPCAHYTPEDRPILIEGDEEADA